MSDHLFSDCQECPYFTEAGEKAELRAKIKEQQQEIDQLKSDLTWKADLKPCDLCCGCSEQKQVNIDHLEKEIEKKNEALRLAMEALIIPKYDENGSPNCYYDYVRKALTAIEKALGGNDQCQDG